MKRSELRQGRTIYLVSTFPSDQKFNAVNSSIKAMLIMSRPYCTVDKLDMMKWRFKARNIHSRLFPNFVTEEFCSTWNIGEKNTFNNHRAFFSLKAAQRYQQRMFAGCLSVDERILTEIVAKRRSIMDTLALRFPPPYFDPEPEPKYTPFYCRTYFPVVIKDYPVVKISGVV